MLAIGIGAIGWATGAWGHLAQASTGGVCEGVSPAAQGGLAGFGAAMLGALWAYDGWNNVAPLSGEVRDPQRTLPRAFLGGMLVVGALYVFANVAYYYVLTPGEIASVSTSSSVATEVASRFLGGGAVTLVAAALMISSFGALHTSVLAPARFPYAMAHDGLFFRGCPGIATRTCLSARSWLRACGRPTAPCRGSTRSPTMPSCAVDFLRPRDRVGVRVPAPAATPTGYRT